MARHRVCAAVAAVACLLTACSSGNPRASDAGGGPPAERSYWPTDDWRTDDPAEHGFDDDELAEVGRLVAESYTNVRSILLVRDGFLVFERYWQGVDAADGHDTLAVTKSVVSALVGIALAEGALESLDQTVGELFADLLPADADPRMAGVTVGQLLSMTSGLPADDPSVGGDRKVFERIEQSPDWGAAILGLPLAADPGSQWAYSNATSHLLSMLVADVTGTSTLDFARDRLFGPLGIDTSDAFVSLGPPTPEVVELYSRARVAWPADPQGYHFGGGFLKLPARDLAKFGFLYLNEGRWEDEQIIPADYVRAASTTSVSTLDPSADYGWHWWVPSDDDDGAFFARGYGGQIVHVDPALDLVTVVTSDAASPRGDVADLVELLILRAARD